MRSLQSSLSTRLQSLKETPKSKAQFSYQALAEEIAAKYQVPWKRFIWLFYKIPENIIRQAFKEAPTIESLIKYAQQLNKVK
jgi:hypothetical protein